MKNDSYVRMLEELRRLLQTLAGLEVCDRGPNPDSATLGSLAWTFRDRRLEIQRMSKEGDLNEDQLRRLEEVEFRLSKAAEGQLAVAGIPREAELALASFGWAMPRHNST